MLSSVLNTLSNHAVYVRDLGMNAVSQSISSASMLTTLSTAAIGAGIAYQSWMICKETYALWNEQIVAHKNAVDKLFFTELLTNQLSGLSPGDNIQTIEEQLSQIRGAGTDGTSNKLYVALTEKQQSVEAHTESITSKISAKDRRAVCYRLAGRVLMIGGLAATFVTTSPVTLLATSVGLVASMYFTTSTEMHAQAPDTIWGRTQNYAGKASLVLACIGATARVVFKV